MGAARHQHQPAGALLAQLVRLPNTADQLATTGRLQVFLRAHPAKYACPNSDRPPASSAFGSPPAADGVPVTRSPYSRVAPFPAIKRLRRHTHLPANLADLLAALHLPQRVHDLLFTLPFSWHSFSSLLVFREPHHSLNVSTFPLSRFWVLGQHFELPVLYTAAYKPPQCALAVRRRKEQELIRADHIYLTLSHVISEKLIASTRMTHMSSQLLTQ